MHTDGVIDDVASRFLPCIEDSDSPGISCYQKDYLESLMPSSKAHMDPDPVNPDVPLFAVKITVMSPGTVVAILLQHGVVDAESTLFFMTSWSRVYRGLELVGSPDHNRRFALDAHTSKTPITVNYTVSSSQGEKESPMSSKLMPKIMGSEANIIPLTKSRLVKMKANASRDLPSGTFFSTDDLITALAWKAFVKARCSQLGISNESEETTVLFRVLNIRSRLEPELSHNLFGNAITVMRIERTVKQVMSMSLTELALVLRSIVQEWTSDQIVAQIKWMKEVQSSGSKLQNKSSNMLLTFLVSSWVFTSVTWEDIDFEATPLFYEQRCHVPFVSVLTSRPGRNGVNVWTSGQQEAMDIFIKEFTSGI